MTKISKILLDWYDIHARDMPWRVSPADRKAGVSPDPYRIWLSEVMLQQTTVAAVKAYFIKFTTIWPTVSDLAAAEDADVMAAWAGLGYYARARNLLKCARVIAHDHHGVFPNSQEALQKLPGIGPYTSAAIASIAFDEAATVVDGNVERVMARLHDIHAPLPAAKPLLTEKANTHTPDTRAGDYAQAVMDIGATICTPKSPACGICPLYEPCKARSAGTASQLPAKTPKKPKPTRYGIAYIAVTHSGDIVLETRPSKGLLGGMLGWPGTEWSEGHPKDTPPFEAHWQTVNIEVRHTFTHFHLVLTVQFAKLNERPVGNFTFVNADSFDPTSLPTVMRKAWAATQSFR